MHAKMVAMKMWARSILCALLSAPGPVACANDATDRRAEPQASAGDWADPVNLSEEEVEELGLDELWQLGASAFDWEKERPDSSRREDVLAALHEGNCETYWRGVVARQARKP